MFQFKTYHNDDSYQTLGEMLIDYAKHGLKVIEQVFDPKWNETAILLEGSKDNFQELFLELTEGDWGSDIEEFMDELVPV